MSFQVPRIRSVIGNTITITHPDIPVDYDTNLSAASATSDTTLYVNDGYGYSDNDYILVGKLGFDKTEICQVNGTVTRSTIPVTTTYYSHPVDTVVSAILWNQVEISGATTAAGTKTVITTIALQPDRSETIYVNTGTTYAYYFVRLKNVNGGNYSEYSDATIATGFPTTSVRYVKDQALLTVNEKSGEFLTERWLDDLIYMCEQEVWSQKKRWSWAYTFNYIVGDTVEGGYRVALPSDISDSNSEKAIQAVRIKDRPDLEYLTLEEWDKAYQNTTHTTLSADVALVDVTLTLTDSSDFDDSGSVVIGDDSIDYTGNTISTGTLTGVTGITSTHTSGDDVWQGVTFSEPTGYTVFNGYLYFDCPIDSTYATKNIYLSYYRKPTAINSDTDTLNIPDWTLYIYFLAWKILVRKANGGVTNESEAMRALYEQRKDILMRRDRTQRTSFRPRLNSIWYSNEDTELISSNPEA